MPLEGVQSNRFMRAAQYKLVGCGVLWYSSCGWCQYSTIIQHYMSAVIGCHNTGVKLIDIIISSTQASPLHFQLPQLEATCVHCELAAHSVIRSFTHLVVGSPQLHLPIRGLRSVFFKGLFCYLCYYDLQRVD